MTGHRRSRLGAMATVVAVALVGSIVVFAIQAEGREGSETSTNDGGAWLVNGRAGSIGHVNRRVEELSAAVRIGEARSRIDVYQPEGLVVAHDQTVGRLRIIDERVHQSVNSLDLPERAQAIAHDHGLVIWAGPPVQVWNLSTATLREAGSLDGLAPIYPGPEAAVDPRLGDDAVIGVSAGGTVLFVAADGTLLSLGPTPDEPPQVVQGLHDAGAISQITFDGDLGLVVASAGIFTVDGLVANQLTGPVDRLVATEIDLGAATGTIAAVTSDGQVLRVDTDDGQTSIIGEIGQTVATDDVAAPIDHDGCVHVLVRQPARLWIGCGTQASKVLELDVGDGADLRLRLVNGWVWVNDVATGSFWLVDDQLGLTRIDDWGAVLPQEHGQADELPPSEGSDEVIDDELNPDAADAEFVEADEYDEDGVNQPPFAEDDEVVTPAGRAAVVDVVANDTDPDNDVLLVESVTNLSGIDARVEAAADGTRIQVTPAVGFVGTVRFSYTITDGRGGRDSATGTVIVDEPTGELNQAPVAVTDIGAVAAGERLVLDVMANDFDPDGDSLVLVDARAPQGSVTFDPAGRVIFEPAVTTGEGQIELTYTIVDDFGERAEGRARVSVRLPGSNRPPDARNDGAVTVAGQPVTINVLANDTDPDGDELFVGSRPELIIPDGVEVFTTISPDGEFVVIPEEPGTYIFTYAVSDGEDSNVAQVRIEATEPGPNRPPVGLRDDVVVPQGESRIAYVMVNDRDPDGDVIGIVDIDVPAGSGLRVERFGEIGLRVFVDGPGTSRRVFTYSISDGASEPVPVTVVVSVADGVGENNPPIAEPDAIEARPGTSVSVAVLDNDFDPEGGPLQVVAVSDPDGAQATIGPQGQTVRLRLDDDVLSSFRVTYDVIDDHGNRTASVIQVTVVAPTEPNRAPIARPDQVLTAFGEPVEVDATVNDSDPDGDPIRVEAIVAQPGSGTAQIDQATGRIIYVPLAGFSGSDRFSYAVIDAFGARSIGEVLVGVMPEPDPNQPPIAYDDSYLTIATGQRIELDLLINDFDPDGDQLQILSTDSVSVGELIGFGDRFLTYIAPTDQPDDVEVVFGYRIGDGRGGQAEATVTILVQATPLEIEDEQDAIVTEPPVAVDDLVGPVRSGTELRVDVVANDFDPDTETADLSVSIGAGVDAQVAGQTVVFIATETVAFDYQLQDPEGNLATAQIIVTVVDPQPPIALDDTAGPVRAGDELTVDVLINDLDPDFDPALGGLELVSVDGPFATIEDDGAGGVIGLIAPDESTQYTYTIRDGDGLEASAVLSLIVTENRPPTVQDVVVETGFEEPIRIDLAPYASDPDGDPLLYVCCTSPANGSPEVIAAGEGELVVEFTPDTGFDGEALFSFGVDDQFGHQASAPVTVVVAEQPNRPPTAVDGIASIEVPRPDGPAVSVQVDLAEHSDDPDPDDVLTWSIVSGPGNGLDARLDDAVLTIEATEASDPGETTIGWRVADGEGESAEAVVTVSIAEPENTLPSAQGSQVNLAAGSSLEVDLTQLASDPDADEILDYSVDAGPAVDGVTITVTGPDVVTVAAAVNAAGRSASFDFAVTDRLGEQATATVDIEVGSPDQDPPEAVDDQAETLQGQPVDIDVLANDVDPIGLGLTVVSPGGTNDGTVAIMGNGVRFIPDAGFFGSTDFAYTIRDGADIADREATGVVTVEVIGRPDAPTVPDCSAGSAEVAVTWTAPAGNGAAITEYDLETDAASTVVSAIDGLTGTSATVDGLTNGVEHRFRVRAHNRAGTGPWSDWSPACVPDIEPERPAAPQVTHGDGWLELAWTEPVNEGSAIVDYEVRIGGGAVQTTTGTSLRWTGLVNGTDYTFQVAARNAKGTSPFSTASIPEHPSTTPDAPTIEATTRAGLVGATASGILQANWTPVGTGADGGDSVIEYRVAQRNGSVVVVSGANTDSYLWSGLDNGTDQQFRVRAINRDGAGPWSSWSAPMAACTIPGAASNPTATGGDRLAQVSFGAPADDGGCAITDYQIRIQGQTGNVASPTAPGTESITGLTNGTAYTFSIRARNTIGAGPWITTNAVTPAGAPICGASFSFTQLRVDTLFAYWDSANANGGTGLTYQINNAGNGWEPTNQTAFGTGWTATWNVADHGVQNTIALRAVTSAGSTQCGSISFLACPSAPPAPGKPTISADSPAGEITTTWVVPTVACHSQTEAHTDTAIRTIEVDPDPGAVVALTDYQSAPSEQHTFTGLADGTSMRTRVRACYEPPSELRSCGAWSPWSDTATIEVPAPEVVITNVVSTFCTADPGSCIWVQATVSGLSAPAAARVYWRSVGGPWTLIWFLDWDNGDQGAVHPDPFEDLFVVVVLDGPDLNGQPASALASLDPSIVRSNIYEYTHTGS